MKVAHLINAHKNFAQLERLIEKLSHESADFYLHLDKKVNDAEYLSIAERLAKYNVTMVHHRLNVAWGGFSQVAATLNGLTTVLESTVRYDYINFISGQDYPLKGNDVIVDFLTDNKGMEFIDCVEVSPAGWAKAMSRFNSYHLSEFVTNRHVRQVCECLLNKTLPKRSFPAGFIPYGGSSWWTISGDCADYILSFSRQNQRFTTFFKLTHAPDEMYFQTIVMNSPYKQQVCNDNLRYIDWSEGKPNPKILTRDDLPKLLTLDKLFARKFDISVDAGVLDLIDNRGQ